MPVQSYAPSISSHISHGNVHRLSNVLIPGYERSERLELPNPASSSRQIIPLEPDFSPSSSNSSQSQLDIGRYTRAHKSPQVVQMPTPIQPEETNFSPVTNQPINYDQFQPNLTQQNKESDSETESEVWSFDCAINEVFRLLPPELCPKTQQDQAPLKPLSGIEQLMESHSTPLLVLPQSKLVENTTKYIQNRLDSDKYSRDWICPQSLV